MLYFIFSLSLLIGITLCGIVPNRKIKRAFLLYEAIWHLPLLLYIVLPFKPNFQISLVSVSALLALVHFVLLPSALYSSVAPTQTGDSHNIYLEAWWHRNQVPLRALWLFSIIGVFFVATDLFVFRGLELSTHLSANRNIYDHTSPSLFGYLGYLASGSALLLVGISAKRRGYKKKLLMNTPFILIALVTLLAGVRQYLLFGLIMLVASYAASRVSWKRLLLTLMALGAGFSSLMVAYNISRQPDTKGSQVQFVEAIGGFYCTKSFACAESPLSETLNYLYQYFGNEYIGFTAISMTPRKDWEPIFSQTVPVIYRRVQSFNKGMPTYQELRKKRLIRTREMLGSYPNFWKTMYADAFLEGGWLGCVILAVILALLLLWGTVRVYSSASPFAFSGFIGIIAILIFGVMYIPTRETFIVAFVAWLPISRLRNLTGGRKTLAIS